MMYLIKYSNGKIFPHKYRHSLVLFLIWQNKNAKLLCTKKKNNKQKKHANGHRINGVYLFNAIIT